MVAIRSNWFENQIAMLLINMLLFERIYYDESVSELRRLKEYDNGNKLFIDARSLNKTPKGRQKKTEFAIHLPKHNINWRIECKSRQTVSMFGEVSQEVELIDKYEEDLYCIIVTDNLNEKYYRDKIIEKGRIYGVSNKLWYGTEKEFKKMLKKRLKK